MTENRLLLTHILNYFGEWAFPYLESSTTNEEMRRYAKWNSEISWYALLLEHMLVDSGHIPKNEMEVKKSVKDLCKNQRIVEVGCRSGVFLHFLADHGAQVFGTTGEKYFEIAQKNMGRRGKVFKLGSEEVGTTKELHSIRPTSLISLNLFEAKRWKETKIPNTAFIRGLYRIATPETKVYVQPATDQKTLLKARHLLRLSRVRDLQIVNRNAQGERRASKHRSYRFRVQRKRTTS